MMAFSKEAELTKAAAELAEIRKRVGDLQDERNAEWAAITEPLGETIAFYINNGADTGKKLAVKMLENSERIVSLLAPDLVDMVRRVSRDLPGSQLQNDAAAMFHKYGGGK